MKKYKDFMNEAKDKPLTIPGIVKILQNEDDWGDEAKARVYTKGKSFVYIDSFYYSSKDVEKSLNKSWSTGGTMHTYFKEECGVDLKVVGGFVEDPAKGRHKKLTKNGVVGVEVAIK